MEDKEKRKNDKPKRDSELDETSVYVIPENLASRQIGCLLSIVGIAACVLTFATPVSRGAWGAIPFFLGIILIPLGLSITLSYTSFPHPKGAIRPTLNQIRQSPDDPLIVQQWNGREWVDTLDMRGAPQADASRPSDTSQKGD